MAPHRPRSSDAVFEVLAVQGRQARSRSVAHPKLAIEIDSGTQCTLSAVELGILVMCEALVVAANLSEEIQPKSGVMAVIDEAALGARAVGRAAAAKR